MHIVQMIEELRREMIRLGMEKGLNDPEVISVSQRLDDYINKFYIMDFDKVKQRLAG